MNARHASIALFLSLTTGAASAQTPHTVPHVDLERYAGKWYEIARFPNKFQ